MIRGKGWLSNFQGFRWRGWSARGFNDNFGVPSYVIIGIFVLRWLGSVVFNTFEDLGPA
jgi:hypothetical protein